MTNKEKIEKLENQITELKKEKRELEMQDIMNVNSFLEERLSGYNYHIEYAKSLNDYSCIVLIGNNYIAFYGSNKKIHIDTGDFLELPKRDIEKIYGVMTKLDWFK